MRGASTKIHEPRDVHFGGRNFDAATHFMATTYGHHFMRRLREVREPAAAHMGAVSHDHFGRSNAADRAGTPIHAATEDTQAQNTTRDRPRNRPEPPTKTSNFQPWKLRADESPKGWDQSSGHGYRREVPLKHHASRVRQTRREDRYDASIAAQRDRVDEISLWVRAADE